MTCAGAVPAGAASDASVLPLIGAGLVTPSLSGVAGARDAAGAAAEQERHDAGVTIGGQVRAAGLVEQPLRHGCPGSDRHVLFCARIRVLPSGICHITIRLRVAAEKPPRKRTLRRKSSASHHELAAVAVDVLVERRVAIAELGEGDVEVGAERV